MRKLIALLPLGLVLVATGCGGSNDVTEGVAAAVNMIDRAELTAAAANLEQWHQAHGTYVGASPGVPGVTLARADGAGWCLQTERAHAAGPNGTPSAGPC
jgi:hypothetical protein